MTSRALPSAVQLPGQMTRAMRAVRAYSGPKELRVGVLRSGKIVDERLVDRGGHLSVGTEPGNTVVTSQGGASFRLLEATKGGYLLHFTEQTQGKVMLPTGLTDLSEARGMSARTASGYTLGLGPDSRGRVTLGDTTVLFQFVAPAPVGTRPQLPSGVSMSLLDSIDWTTAMLAAMSFLFHFGAVGTLYSDWGDRVLPNEADVRGIVIKNSTLPTNVPIEQAKPEIDSTQKTADNTDAKRADPAKKSPGQSASPTGHTAPPPANATEAALRALERMDQQLLTLGVLDPSRSAIARVLADGNLPADRLDGFARSEQGSKSRDSDLRLAAGAGPIDGRNRKLSEMGDTGVAPGTTDSGTRQVLAAPRPTVTETRANTAGRVSNFERTLAGARGAARRCYEGGLGGNPEMEGRVSYSITVGPSGSVQSVSASPSGSLSPGVSSCVAGVLRGLNFDAPENGASAVVSGSYSFVLSRAR